MIRRIQKSDNQQVAKLIREVMTEFGCVGNGYSIEDSEIDSMYESYNLDDSAFFVVEIGKEILGCGGIGPLSGGDLITCELRKMYFRPKIRGRGIGRLMMQNCLATAFQLGYRNCYLETVSRMQAANILYKKLGFLKLDQPIGETGHFTTDTWYLRPVDSRDCRMVETTLEF